MSYYDYIFEDDFYAELSEFDRKVDEFKESLMESVKEEFINELEDLKKENESLQDVKKNFESIKRDYANKERQLEIEKSNLERKVRNARLSELTKDHRVIMYKVYSKRVELPKCDKCDENRQIPYVTPLGKTKYETCDCDIGELHYYPKEHIRVVFNIRNGINAWYELKGETEDEEYMAYDRNPIYAEKIYNGDEDYSQIKNSYRTFFKTKEECQKYCDWLNENGEY